MRDNGTLLWRDHGIGQVGQGGLIGMALIGAMGPAAVSSALDDLLASIPKRGEAPMTAETEPIGVKESSKRQSRF